MVGYTVRVLPSEYAVDLWCDLCEEAKRPIVWLVPAEALVSLQPGEPPGLLLCGGCGDGLATGQRLDEADLAARRERRRGSQEP